VIASTINDYLIFTQIQIQILDNKLHLSSVYENGHTDVCLSVGVRRANENPNPSTDLVDILHTHPHLCKEGFGAVLTSWQFKKLRETFLKMKV